MHEYVSVCLSVGLVTGIPSLSIIGWFCSIPLTAASLIPRLCPLKFSVILLPSDGGSGPPLSSISPPSQILPDSLSPAVRPFPLFLSFVSSPPVAFSLPSPPQQRLIPRRPSGGLLRWTPTKCPLLGSGAPHADVLPPYAAGGTWLGCGLGGVEDGAPRDCP